MQLTDRQQILFDRLVTLGEWVMDGELPLTIFEITGFGSFFRGKPRPRDVDLIVRIQHSERLPEFDKFVEVLKSFRNDLDLEDQHQTPHAALVQMISARDKRIADIPENNLREISQLDRIAFVEHAQAANNARPISAGIANRLCEKDDQKTPPQPEHFCILQSRRHRFTTKLATVWIYGLYLVA